MSARLLIVDDDSNVRFGLRKYFEAHDYEVSESATCAEGERDFTALRPDVAIVDHKLPDGNAVDLLTRFRKVDPDIPVVVLTGYGSIDLAVEAIKSGAENFLTKPVQMSALRVIIERAVVRHRTKRNEGANRVKQERGIRDPFVGVSQRIASLREDVERLLAASSPILIHGETGTGKGVLANWIHKHSPRSQEAFVELNCGGLSRDFLESELFGHAQGAYTGASTAKKGLFDVGHRGTIFLDEIGDVPTNVQPKLLKVLEDSRFRRLGEVRERSVDVRLIAASHRDLLEMVEANDFRRDLYFRISTLPLRLPALRERTEDIPAIAEHVLAELRRKGVGRAEVLAPDAMTRLQSYQWPGNIRELRNVLERALLLGRDKAVIRADDLRFDRQPHKPQSPALSDGLTLLEMERLHIWNALVAEGGNVARAAERLAIPRSTLYQRLKKHNIDPGAVAPREVALN